MPINEQKLRQIIADERGVSARQASLSMPVSPDDMGRALDIGSRRNLPPLVVAQNLPEFDERDRLDDVQEAAKDPVMGRWLQKPEHAALAKDDIASLRRLASTRPNGTMSATPEPSFVEEVVKAAHSGFVRGKNYVNTFLLDPLIPDVRLPEVRREQGDASAAVRFASEERRAQGIERVGSATQEGLDEIANANGWWQSLGAIVSNPRATGLTIAQSLGMFAPGLAATYAGSTLGPGGTAAAAGGSSFALEYGASISTAMQRAGVDQTDPVSVKRFLSNPQQMAAAREYAVRRGVPIALFDAATAGVAGRLIMGTTGSVGSAVARTAGEAGVQSAGGAAGELTAQVVSGDEIAPADILMEAIAEVPTGIVEAAGNYRHAQAIGRVVRSTRDVQTLREFTEAAGEAKTGQRAPAAVEALVGDAGAVYVPAEAIRTLYQAGDAGAFVASLTGDEAALANAGEHGDIAIPAAKWASVVSRLPNAAEWAKHGRTDVDGYSAADLEGLDLDAELGLVEQAEAPESDTSAEVQKDVLAQLMATGTYTPADAELQANVMGKVFGTLAARTGQDAKALYDRYQLRINGPEPNLAQRAVAGVKRLFQGKPQEQTETPQFRNWFGDSKVTDADGKPLVVYHGTGDVFDVFDNSKATGSDKNRAGVAWFSDAPEVASGFAGNQDGSKVGPYQLGNSNVMPVYLSMRNPYIDTRGEYARGGGLKREVVAELEAEGYDGIIWPESQFDLPDTTMDGPVHGYFRNRHGEVFGDDVPYPSQYAVFRPEQIKSATANSGDFDPANPSILRQPADGGGARGQLEIGDGRRMSIRLFRGANRSTFLHESAHFYLEVLQDLKGMEAELAAVRQWVGNDGGEFTTEQHEQFARGFEAYLFEGKAPSPELVTAFARFRSWLIGVYKSLRNLNVELTDDVRGVFDRLIATDEEIEAAQQKQGMVPMLTQEQGRELGLTDKQWEAYVASLEAGTEEARQEVAAKMLAAIKRQEAAEYREEREKVREEVEAEAELAPVVRAWRILSGAETVNGEPVPAELRGLHLDPEAILPDDRAAIRGMGITRKTGGVHPDTAAAVLGYSSGDALVQALGNVRSLKDQVEMEVDRRMAERYPDPITELPEEAMKAIHGNKRVAAMEAELDMLARVSGQPRPNRRQLRAIAEARIARQRIRDIRPNTHLVSERKAARKATEAAAKGDYAAALKAKREQLLSAALYSEAIKATDRVGVYGRYLRKMASDKARAKLGKVGGDYLDQVDSLLDRFDFRTMTGKDADRRASFAAWIRDQEANGIALDLPVQMLDDAFRKPWREMTVAELQGLRDTIKQIDHLATLKGKLVLAGEIRDAAEIDAAMAESVREHNKERQQTTGDKSNSDKLREALMQGRALQGAATDLSRELDGFTDGGPVWSHVVRPIREAMNNLRPALRQVQESLSGIYLKHYTREEIRDFNRARAIPEVNGDKWSKRRILALALNWGNEGNREAILSQARNRLTPEQVNSLLSRLDARDWAFVQDVWELVDAQWPAIAEAQKRRTGLVPEKVQATGFTVRTADGETLQISGGYYPLKYESDSVKSMRDEAEDFWNAIRMGRSAKAATKNGHTIERVGSGGRTVNLELGLIQSHLRDVLRDLHLGDAVNYVHNTLNGHGFAEALADTGMLEHRQALEVWLKDVASGEIAPRKRHEQAARALRLNFTASVLAYKVVSAAIQVTGIVQSSVVLGQAATWHGVQQYLRRPVAMTRYVTEASPMMLERATTHVEAVQQVMDAEAGRLKAGHSAMVRWGYWMMGQIQRTVDVATWLAAETKGMELFNNDVAAARAYADDVVIRAQATSEFVDKTPLQRGTLSDNVRQTEYLRAVTTLASYMLAKGNIAYERTKQTNFRKPGQALKWSRDMATLFVFEALIVNAIRGQWPDDDDEDGMLDEVGMLALEETFFGMLGGIPGIGAASGSLRGYGSGGVVASAFEAIYRAQQQARQGELDKAAIKSAVTLTGYGTGIPAGQINKTIDAIAAEREGEDVNALQYLVGPPRD